MHGSLRVSLHVLGRTKVPSEDSRGTRVHDPICRLTQKIAEVVKIPDCILWIEKSAFTVLDFSWVSCSPTLLRMLVALSLSGKALISTHGGDLATGHMKLMRTQPAPTDGLHAVLPPGSNQYTAKADLESFWLWCAGENALAESVRGIENLAVAWTEEGGLSLSAVRDLPAPAGEEVFNVPPQMLLPATLCATKATMGERLGCEQYEMLLRAQQLTQNYLGHDLSMWVLLWQLIVEAHAPSAVTPNPSSRLEPWLRTYRYATMHARGWTDDELAWVSPLPWACSLVGTSEWCVNELGELGRTTDEFCMRVLPVLRQEFPSQLPATHFTPAGFEWVSRLHRTRNMGGRHAACNSPAPMAQPGPASL